MLEEERSRIRDHGHLDPTLLRMRSPLYLDRKTTKTTIRWYPVLNLQRMPTTKLQ